mmetsp:Transcript_14548/g.27579  ORF Transcript_14548/g.27579 Transcript_14548/m.27579 type:complete len:195 (+) Transcript_14548:318-902(+)
MFKSGTFMGEESTHLMYKCILDGKQVAVFVVVAEEEELNYFRNKVKTLQNAKHKKIVGPIAYCDGKTPCVVLNLFKEGTLKDFLLRMRATGKDLDIQQKVRCSRDLADALYFLHRDHKGLLSWHRDLRPENIFMDNDGGCQLANFSISSMVVVSWLSFFWEGGGREGLTLEPCFNGRHTSRTPDTRHGTRHDDF